jgi:hypothetical protein
MPKVYLRFIQSPEAKPVLFEDGEEQGHVTRLTVSGGTKEVFRRVLVKVRDIIRANIRTNFGGRWMPVQWGPRKGQKALTMLEYDWEIRGAPGGAVISPPADHQLRWAGHVKGSHIRPVRAKWLTFMSGGKRIFTKHVKLPKRDPRPMVSQLR